MRLIDADALKSHLWDNVDFSKCTYCWSEVCDAIDNAPTVEFPEQITIKCDTEEDKQKLLSAFRNARATRFVEDERPTGHWIKHISNIECSNCGEKFYCEEDENCQDYEPCNDFLFNYCPNCGAKMKKETEND